jgi:hypothetical protein
MSVKQRTRFVTITAFVGLLLAAPAFAQQSAQKQDRHVVDHAAMQAAVTQKLATDATDRAVVLNALHQPEAQSLAAGLGLSASQVDSAVATMSPSELNSVVGPASLAAAAQAGGDVIVISVTTLLLLLILLILLVR